ncbi:hypothetical protein GE061_000372 [Apolygus lucorum]|uniref:Cilia- and flagella-associated protein 57 n=1 Tax=Apolygus lucorum TaxID=248454 RepID=A0A8S9Y8B3_APOLU|nr:hypothetical protein GE061_000372 [Apolygus lucorum]
MEPDRKIKFTVPKLKPKLFCGLSNDIQGNAHFISENIIIHPIGRVLVIDNLEDYSQQYIKLPQSHKVVNIVTISPDRELIAVSEEATRPTVSVYEIRTKIRLKLLGNPIQAGTKDGRIVVVESADLRGVYKAYDLNEIYLKVKVKEADGRQNQVSLASNQVTDLEKSGIYEVRALTAFSEGFAYSCCTGTINVFRRTEVNKWIKYNIIDVRGPALGTMDLTKMDQVNFITVSPAEKKMMVTTGRTDLYVGDLFQEQNMEKVVGLRDRTCRIWDYKQKNVVLIKDFPDEIYSAAFHPSGFYCLLGFTDKLKLLMILIDDMKPIRHVDIKGCTLVEFSKGGHIFAAVNGVAVELYSSVTFQNLAILTGHIGPVRAVQFVKDDCFLYTCGQEGSLYKWNIQNQKRIEDIFTKGCANYDVAAKTAGDMVYTVGTDGTLKEIMDGEIIKTVPLNQYALHAIVISHSDQLMFVGGEKGCVVSVVYPLVYPPAYKEFSMHTQPVTKILITNDDDIVVSVSAEGALCIWEIKNAKGKKKNMLAGFSHLTEVILDIEEWTRRIEEIGELRTRMAEVEGEHSYVVRQVTAAHEATLKEVHGGYIQSIEDLKGRIKQMEREHLLELHNYSTRMEELMNVHGHELDTKERQYASKFIREYERYDDLVENTKMKIGHFKRKFRALKKAAKKVIDSLREEKDEIIEIKSQKIKELETRIREMMAQSEQNKARTEMECDIEITEARNSFLQQLKEKDETIINLNNSNGLLVKRSKMLEDSIKANEDNIEKLKEKCQLLTNTIVVSSKEIEVLKREVDERDITIARKDELVVKVTKKNEMCSKEKYVRDTQLECLKFQLQPKIEEIEKLRCTTAKLESEITKLVATVKEEQFNCGKQRGLSEVLGTEINVWKEQIRKTERFIRLILLDIFTLATSAYNANELHEAVQSLYDKYVPQNKVNDLDSEKILAIQNEEHVEKLHSIIRNLKKNSAVKNKVSSCKTPYSWTCSKRIKDVLQHLKETQFKLEKERERVKTLERTLLGMNYVRPSRAKEIYEKTCKLYELPQRISHQDQIEMTKQWSNVVGCLVEEIQYLTGIPILEYIDYNAARLGGATSSALVEFLGNSAITAVYMKA